MWSIPGFYEACEACELCSVQKSRDGQNHHREIATTSSEKTNVPLHNGLHLCLESFPKEMAFHVRQTPPQKLFLCKR